METAPLAALVDRWLPQGHDRARAAQRPQPARPRTGRAALCAADRARWCATATRAISRWSRSTTSRTVRGAAARAIGLCPWDSGGFAGTMITLPRPQPTPVVLEGRYARLEPLSLAHAGGLYKASSEAQRFDYLARSAARATLPKCKAWIEKSPEEQGLPLQRGHRPDQRRSDGPPGADAHRSRRTASSRSATSCWGPAIARTRVATEAFYLRRAPRVRRARLSPLRVEVQRPQRAVEGGRRALRLHVRRRVPPAHGRQGREPRHCAGSRSSIASGRKSGPRSSAGWIRPTSMPRVGRRRQLAARRRVQARLATALNIFRGDTLPGPGISLVIPRLTPGVARADPCSWWF